MTLTSQPPTVRSLAEIITGVSHTTGEPFLLPLALPGCSGLWRTGCSELHINGCSQLTLTEAAL